MIGDDIVVARRGAVEMDLQVVALGYFPVEAGLTFGTNGFHDHFVAYIIYTARIVCNGQADYIGAGLFISVVWIGAIACVSIPKVPHIGDDVMIAGGCIVKMELQCIRELLPIEISITFSGHWSYGDFVAYIADTTYRVGDDETDQVSAWLFVCMCGIGTIAGLTIPEIPLVRDDVMVAGGGIDKIDFEGTGILFPFKTGMAI